MLIDNHPQHTKSIYKIITASNTFQLRKPTQLSVISPTSQSLNYLGRFIEIFSTINFLYIYVYDVMYYDVIIYKILRDHRQCPFESYYIFFNVQLK